MAFPLYFDIWRRTPTKNTATRGGIPARRRGRPPEPQARGVFRAPSWYSDEAEPYSGGVRRPDVACDKATANGIPTSNVGIQVNNTFKNDDDVQWQYMMAQKRQKPTELSSKNSHSNTGTGLPFTAHHTRTTFQTPQRRSSLFNLQRCSLATVLEDSQFQRALARHAQRCSRFAVTLVADSMDASGLTARDSRSARARPRRSSRAAFASAT